MPPPHFVKNTDDNIHTNLAIQSSETFTRVENLEVSIPVLVQYAGQAKGQREITKTAKL